MLITDKELKRVVCDYRNMQTGRQYYQKNYVKKINIYYEYLFDDYIIKGIVDNGNYENECMITIDNNNKIIDYECDCYWCSTDSACGHIAAILLKVQELSPDVYPFEYYNDIQENSYAQRLAEIRRKKEEEVLKNELSMTKNIISDFKDIKTKSFNLIKQNEKIDLEIQIKVKYGEAYLKFRVGNDKKYAIKNIPDFLNAISNSKYVEYGKQLCFVHNRDIFSDEAKKIIDLIKYCIAAYEQSYFGYYYGGSRVTNEIRILSENIDIIYETVKDLNNNAIISIYQCNHLPTIDVEKSDKFYLLRIQDVDGICGSKDLYKIDDNKIGITKLDNDGKAIKFIQHCLQKGGLYLSEEDVDDFYKYILNDIKQYFNLTGDKLISNVANDESITLYAEINEIEQISVYLEEKRNHHIIYSFDHEGEATSVNFDLIENYLKDISDVIDYEKHCIYINLENEKAFTFLNQGLPFLANYCEIMVSEALKKIGKKSQFNISVGVTIENDLLAIDLESIDIPSEELTAVLSSYQRKKKFHRLKNGQLLYLDSNELEELDNFMNDYNLKPQMFEDGHLDLNVYRAFSIDNQAEKSNYINFDRSEIFKETIDNFRDIRRDGYVLSKKYNNILRDYQKFGYQWLQSISAYGFGGILADDMGLGKTLQIIALLDENRSTDKTSLVICPSSLLLNWQDEIHKFSTTLTCQCVYGSLQKRKLAIDAFNDVDILITTYDYIRRDYKLYQDYQFEYLILDEAQYIKNPKTKNAFSVKTLKAKHRFALTGTPIENSLAELWSIFDFLMPDYLFNYHYFQSHYETPIVKNHDEQKQQELKKLISPFILRRNKKEVLTELPEKIEKTISLEFNKEEQKLYLANLVQVNKDLQKQLNYEKIDRIAILAMLTRLRQICCEPRVLYENITNISSKLEGCLDLIRNFQGNNQKVLLFSSFTSVLDLIIEELEKEQISYYKLTGDTKKEERHRLVNQFQSDNTIVFLISLKAGGTGLNLTAAEAVIHFDPWWNMSAQNQATDRAHRIGQQNVVTVYKLVMKDSIEEKILDLQNKKKNLADSFVEGNEGGITSMSTDDIIELFKV